MSSKILPLEAKEFQKIILAYYKQHGRTLPWRKTQDPYKVLVSELMLQQTQVDRVIPKYEAFIEAFPTPQSLAQADLKDVLVLWQGLGYNRRAKYLWHAANLFLTHPKPTYEQLLAQKGIGEYTAAAVCAFAYNEQRAAIDVNVRRVFERFFGDVDDAFITQIVPEDSRDWHNALMDFGSQVCTKKNPGCTSCPLAEKCHALAHNSFSSEPTKSQKKFLGSVRWHRGQLLKASLKEPIAFEEYFALLDKAHRDKEKARLAAHQLVTEKLIVVENDVFTVN